MNQRIPKINDELRAQLEELLKRAVAVLDEAPRKRFNITPELRAAIEDTDAKLSKLPALLSRKEVASLLGWSVETLDRRRKQDMVPKPHIDTPHKPYWAKSEIAAWIRSQP